MARVLRRIEQLRNGQCIVQIFAFRFAKHDADHAPLVVQQRTTAIAWGSCSRKAQPFPFSVTSLGGHRGQKTITYDDPFAQRIANGENFSIELWRTIDLELARRLAIDAGEHDEVAWL